MLVEVNRMTNPKLKIMVVGILYLADDAWSL